ncbi:MAG: flagellar export chaperone FliS [Lachnoclostridium sp.]|jgi:flagellar protein FliS|nr:flagellar export chaperone FliS [Lachnoclostridium sp.]
MNKQAANIYQNNAISTASPAKLTLMLYEGAIKFCNIALIALEEKDYEKVNTNIQKAENIIMEFRITLDHKYPVWEDFERVYEYIYNRLVEGNMAKDTAIIEEALGYIREMRDTWKEVMKLNNVE